MNNHIEIKNISKSYINQKKISVLKNITYKFKKGKIGKITISKPLDMNFSKHDSLPYFNYIFA